VKTKILWAKKLIS
jgi:hypothetical protein